MLLFRSEEEVEHWCASEELRRGEVLDLDTVMALSRLWYRDRLDETFRGRSAAEAEAIFAKVGLIGSFWRMSGAVD